MFNFIYPRLIFVNAVSSSSCSSRDDSFCFGWMFHWFCGSSVLLWLSISRSTNLEGIILSIAIGADTASLNKLWTKASVCWKKKERPLINWCGWQNHQNKFIFCTRHLKVIMCCCSVYTQAFSCVTKAMFDKSRYMSQHSVILRTV